MVKLTKQLSMFRKHPTDQVLAKQIIATAIVVVLQQRRLLGEVLLQLPRQISDQASDNIGLRWQGSQLQLVISTKYMQTVDAGTLTLMLEHQALHLLWQHPLRYQKALHPGLVKVATDVAVNQYLPVTPAGTTDLGQMERLLQRKLPQHQDSGIYLRILETLTIQERKRLKHAGWQLDKSDPMGKQGSADNHQGWQSGVPTASEQNIRLAHLKAITQRAFQRTPHRDRGLIPGEVLEQLQGPNQAGEMEWRKVLRRQVGLMVHGRKETHARFNRRQPVRMELAGQVSRLVNELLVFVDNSGSVSNQELSQVLNEIRQLKQRYDVSLTMYPFDAKVHENDGQTGTRMIKMQRSGGGGTAFQPIFDFLESKRINPATHQIIIITDGYGERKINQYQYKHIDWLLTSSPVELSVVYPQGRILTMKGDY
ncbi:VWA-like domain-containing protein [Limosilactobacillus frumenti]|uniref:vWA domain-containing protein n=1 Tax=Limosilactobacillus frumenti TaxID=104955 RepID=UPI00070AA7F8|nr:VWA-like domain-containing protein [Limosilactobacillus frumenti]MBA2913946.1 peptidase [Limosilactobacillus frumenti]QFG73295.1 peptidase [Limosilactobacillus frumenti]